MAVMIGIDPHKASHTAVAIDPAVEVGLGELRVPLGDESARAPPVSWAAALAGADVGGENSPAGWATCWPGAADRRG